MCADSSTDTKNKGRHGTDPWSHQILPLLKLDVPTGIRRPHDHGFALQAEDHGKNSTPTLARKMNKVIYERQWP